MKVSLISSTYDILVYLSLESILLFRRDGFLDFMKQSRYTDFFISGDLILLLMLMISMMNKV